MARDEGKTTDVVENNNPHETANTPENSQTQEVLEKVEDALSQGQMSTELDPSGNLKFNYIFASKLSPIKEVGLDFQNGILVVSAKIKELIDHIVEATPTKKDDKIFSYFDGFLLTGLKFLAFSKQVDKNLNVSLDESGMLTLNVTVPDHLSTLNNIELHLRDGVLDSNVDLFKLTESLVKASRTKKDDAIYEHAKGFIKLVLKFLVFKKKFP